MNDIQEIMVEIFSVTVDKKEYIYRLEITASGAFKYGNGKMMTVYCNDQVEGTYDVRYIRECNTKEGFHSWSEEFIRDHCREDAVIKRVEENIGQMVSNR